MRSSEILPIGMLKKVFQFEKFGVFANASSSVFLSVRVRQKYIKFFYEKYMQENSLMYRINQRNLPLYGSIHNTACRCNLLFYIAVQGIPIASEQAGDFSF